MKEMRSSIRWKRCARWRSSLVVKRCRSSVCFGDKRSTTSHRSTITFSRDICSIRAKADFAADQSAPFSPRRLIGRTRLLVDHQSLVDDVHPSKGALLFNSVVDASAREGIDPMPPHFFHQRQIVSPDPPIRRVASAIRALWLLGVCGKRILPSPTCAPKRANRSFGHSQPQRRSGKTVRDARRRATVFDFLGFSRQRRDRTAENPRGSAPDRAWLFRKVNFSSRLFSVWRRERLLLYDRGQCD